MDQVDQTGLNRIEVNRIIDHITIFFIDLFLQFFDNIKYIKKLIYLQFFDIICRHLLGQCFEIWEFRGGLVRKWRD